MAAPTLAGSIDNLLYDTPLTPLADMGLNGTLFDLVDAAHRVGSNKGHFIITWIDSASTFLVTAFMASLRLVHDLALAIFYALAFPFSASARNSCKIHLGRAAIDLAGALGSIVSVFYPPLIKTIVYKILESREGSEAAVWFELAHEKINEQRTLIKLRDRFFEKV